MLAQHSASVHIAVRDIAAARQFYERTLGLQAVTAEAGHFVTYHCGEATVRVYRSDQAGTNRATAMSWTVGKQVRALVQDLAARGVRFEHSGDRPGLTFDGAVHEGNGMQIAWFKDPDGNILSIISG